MHMGYLCACYADAYLACSTRLHIAPVHLLTTPISSSTSPDLALIRALTAYESDTDDNACEP